MDVRHRRTSVSDLPQVRRPGPTCGTESGCWGGRAREGWGVAMQPQKVPGQTALKNSENGKLHLLLQPPALL